MEKHHEDAEKKTVGYVVNFIIDYGNGRQVQITGNLPLNAALGEFNTELDKLRLATNRQMAFVSLRNQQAILARSRKQAVIIEAGLVTYQKAMDEELARVEADPKSRHHGTGKMLTAVEGHLTSLRNAVSQRRATDEAALLQVKGEIEIAEVLIGSYEAEIAEIDKALEG